MFLSWVPRAKERDHVDEDVLWIQIGGIKVCNGGDMVGKLESRLEWGNK